MELYPPRYNTYSSVANAIEQLKEKGYLGEYSVKDEYTLEDEKGNILEASQLNIDELIRFDDNEKKTGKIMVIAMNANTGGKGILTSTYGEGSDDTISRFLQKVGQGDGPNQKYQ